jgi:anaerobic selenocysteine-containing dehydrogenase
MFPTYADYCETYGHDLLTGAEVSEQAYRAMNPAGRAVLRAAKYVRQHEPPDAEYPFQFTTGRTVYHFHTRTKTARSDQLNRAAPAAWIEISTHDAERLDIEEGDIVRITSRRGELVVPARIGEIRPGSIFAPFHYGYWDQDRSSPDVRPSAANELTLTEWDPVSKQPMFKNAAVRIECVRTGSEPAPAPTTTASRPSGEAPVPPSTGGPAARATERFDVSPPSSEPAEDRS